MCKKNKLPRFKWVEWFLKMKQTKTPSWHLCHMKREHADFIHQISTCPEVCQIQKVSNWGLIWNMKRPPFRPRDAMFWTYVPCAKWNWLIHFEVAKTRGCWQNLEISFSSLWLESTTYGLVGGSYFHMFCSPLGNFFVPSFHGACEHNFFFAILIGTLVFDIEPLDFRSP